MDTRAAGDQVTESDYKRTTPTRSESESDTGAPDSVIRTESDAQTDRANISMANGPTDSNGIPSSSDSAVCSLGERLTQTKSVSKSAAGIPDPVIQTGSEVHTGPGEHWYGQRTDGLRRNVKFR